MKPFFSQVWATVVGLFIFSTITTVFSILLFVVVAAGMAAISKKPVKDKTVIKIDFSTPIAEKSKENPFGEFFGEEDKHSLDHIVKTIRHAANDEHVAGILINSRQVKMGLTTSATIRKELEAFKKSGKFIKSFSDLMTEGAYYMSSVANTVYLAPEGIVELNGIGGNQPFLKGMFEKLEIEPQIFRVGKFKGAVEPFIRDNYSEENKLQTRELLNSVYTNMLADIAQDRKLTVEELRKISDSLLVRDAELAKKYKLVDEVAYFDKVETDIRKQLKLEDDDKITYMSLSKYGGAVDLDKDEPKKDEDADDNKIAVIYAEGGISTGNSDEGIGSDDLVPLIRKAREDKKVKAVVLRVNSPGGDALASDLIWREVTLTNETKPVIASMGDVAASGGYYISMGARKIYAQPSTITGSIGVFGMLFNVGPMLKNKAGISFDAVSTGGYTVFPNATRKMTASESAIVQHGVDRIYDVFTSKAAEGRHMDVNALREIAQGRVWSGETAKKIGLVDEMGGLDEAVAAAAKMAKLKKGGYVIKRMPEAEDFTMELVKKLTGEDESTEAKVQAMAKVLGPQYSSSLALFMQVQSWQGYQARMPLQVEWN